MSGKVFLDTNVFIYAYDENDQLKKSLARELIRTVTREGTGVISYQVAQEFFNVALKRNSIKMRAEDTQQLLATVFRPLLSVHSSIALFSTAILLQASYCLSWYDSLIVAAAQQSGCELLYTEDMQDGQHFGNLVVRNPFK